MYLLHLKYVYYMLILVKTFGNLLKIRHKKLVFFIRITRTLSSIIKINTVINFHKLLIVCSLQVLLFEEYLGRVI